MQWGHGHVQNDQCTTIISMDVHSFLDIESTVEIVCCYCKDLQLFLCRLKKKKKSCMLIPKKCFIRYSAFYFDDLFTLPKDESIMHVTEKRKSKHCKVFLLRANAFA